MVEMDGAHLSAWFHYLTTSKDLEHAIGPEGRGNLSELMDLPASCDGAGLQSLEALADEEYLGSFAGIAATLIFFCMNTELIPIYIKIAEVLERVEEPDSTTGSRRLKECGQ